ncbi:MAG: peptide-methionine (S)-S-oxide reductase [Bacteroidetes bacterium]|nr:MAG: peptide-methionine (S)-S-oxide reductase [Bacteroidota bacterium]
MKKLILQNFVYLFAIVFFACATQEDSQVKEIKLSDYQKDMNTEGKITLDTATFGAGCFWCVEGIFQRVEGVEKVVSGYTGGKNKNPTYKEVCSGLTGHAEVCQIVFDPKKVSFKDLLEVFWGTHDPTTLNKQGHDEGTQYRSAIFYHNNEQKDLAEKYKKELSEAKIWQKPIVTEITAIPEFYVAEDYHQNYYNQNTNESYCSFVITPKIEKFKKVFGAKMKKQK